MLNAADLIKVDQEYVIHPLHHPADHADPNFSGYAGSSNVPAIMLAERLIEIIGGDMQAVFFTCGGAVARLG